MTTPTTVSKSQPPRFAEEIRKMEYEPLDIVEKKLIWYTFFTGVILRYHHFWIAGVSGNRETAGERECGFFLRTLAAAA